MSLVVEKKISTPVHDIEIFSNEKNQSAIIKYKSSSDQLIKISIISNHDTKVVKEIVCIAGNPGGKKGENSVFFSAKSNEGSKILSGVYNVRFCINKQQYISKKTIQF